MMGPGMFDAGIGTNPMTEKMTDDVKWLRKLRNGGCLNEKCVTCNIRCGEIADRLEQLAAENAVLNSWLAELHGRYFAAVKNNEALMAERDKLRAALEKYADRNNWNCTMPGHMADCECERCFNGWVHCFDEWAHKETEWDGSTIARIALGKESENVPPLQ